MSRPPETPPKTSPEAQTPRATAITLLTTQELHAETLIPLRPRQRFWLVEIWHEGRETFKEFVKHSIYFGLIYASLAGFHALGFRSGLPKEQLDILDKVHFYASLIILVIFSASFIIKALLYEYRVKPQ